MRSDARTVKEYLAALPSDRRQTLEAVRRTILDNLGRGYEEGMQYGVIGYYVPHAVYPSGYHCDPEQPLPFASLASQKNHMALYLFCIYSDDDEATWFREAWKKTGKKLDMGKSCVRFKRLDDVALDVIGKAIKRMPTKKFIAQYESAFASTPRRSGTSTRKVAETVTKISAKKAATKKSTAKRKTGKRPVAKKKTATASRTKRSNKKAVPAKKARARRSS